MILRIIANIEKNLSEYPLIYVAVAIVCGIFCGSVGESAWWIGFCIALGGLVGMLLTYRKHIFIAFAAIFFVSLGWSLTRYHIANSQISFSDNKEAVQLLITDYPSVANNSIKAESELIINGKTYRVLLTLNRDSIAECLTIGDVLLVYGKLSLPQNLNPESFDYGRYLKMQGYSAIIYATSWKITKHIDINSLRIWGRQQQRKVVDYYRNCGFGPRELGVISALTIGEKEYLDAETRQAFSAAGAMHVLAVSGLHIGIIYLILVNIFTFWGRYKPLRSEYILQTIQSSGIIAVLWIYAIITGLSPSVVRASLMFSLGEVGRGLHRRDFGLNIVGASAVISLLFNPLSLFSISFQLSYCAVLAIMTIGQKLDMYAVSWLRFSKNDSKYIRFLKKVVRYIVGLLTISLAAQIGTLPITLYYFNQFSVYFMLTNSFVLPFAEFIAFFILILLPFAPIVPQSAYILLCNYVEWVEQLPHSTLVLWIDIFQVILIFGIIIASYHQRWHYMAALITLVFIGYNVYLKNSNLDEQKMIVYANRKADVIQIIDHGKNTIFTNDSAVALTLTRSVSLKYDLTESAIYPCQIAYKFDEIGSLCIINDSILQGCQLPYPLNCDMLLLGDVGHVGAERLLRNIEAKQIILLGTMKSWKKSKIEELTLSKGISTIDLIQEGAFVYEFR